jgi:DNA-binding FadR family transcriptional regulator
VAEGHGAIVDAIESGEQTAVRRAVREHLELTRTAWPQTAAPDPAAA